jgi:hypothetical protein
MGSVWVLGNVKWKAIDPGDRRKQLILQIVADLKDSWSRLRVQTAKLISKRSHPSNFE